MNKKYNKIYEREIDGEQVYCLEHIPTGMVVIFDKDEGARKRIEEEIERGRTALTPKKRLGQKHHNFVFRKSKNRAQNTSLANVLYAYYHNLSLDELSAGSHLIRHISCIEGISEDCRRKNLYSTKEIVLDTPNREISFTEDGKHIKVYLKASNTYEYFTNTPEILSIIGKPANVSLFLNEDGRAQARIQHPLTEKGNQPYLNVLAYACYYMGVNENNFRIRLPEIMSLMKSEDEGKDTHVIDHVNSDIHNHCKWNLSCVSARANAEKHNYAARIKPPYYLFIAVTDSGEYRVELGYREYIIAFGQEVCLVCPDIQHLNHFLRKVMGLEKTPIGLKRGKTPNVCWAIDKKARYAALNFDVAARKAEKFLKAETEDFCIYDMSDNSPVFGLLR